MTPWPVAFLLFFPAGALAGFLLASQIAKGIIMSITADFQTQFDRLTAAAAKAAEDKAAAVAAATAAAAQDAADNLAGLTTATDAVVAATGG